MSCGLTLSDTAASYLQLRRGDCKRAKSAPVSNGCKICAYVEWVQDLHLYQNIVNDSPSQGIESDSPSQGMESL